MPEMGFSWERERFEESTFKPEELKAADRERELLAPVTETLTGNTIEIAFESVVHAQTTAVLLKGTVEEDMEEPGSGDYDLEDIPIVAAGLPLVGLLPWVFRFLGVSYLLKTLGLPTPVMDLLRWTGETLGLDTFTRYLPFLGETRVAVYYKNQLLGNIELESWADFRSSMARAVWERMRLRMSGG